MGIPLGQAVAVGSYILSQHLRGRKRYPLVLMLEPLFRCNLACAGCGKIDYPDEILNQRLSVAECLEAVDECGAPVVSIAGGEPLVHRELAEVVKGILARRKFVYLCTNALLMQKKLDQYQPSPFFVWSVHLDGDKEMHDRSVCQTGVYERAPDQEHFLHREKTKQLFRDIFRRGRAGKAWSFSQSGLFLDFLAGNQEYHCTPWGNPTRTVFGWQRPCYLLGEGYAKTFRELMEETDWDSYGTGNYAKCANCMVHSGYEATAVQDAIAHPVKALQVALRGVRTEGPMAPEIPLDRQRPAQYVFSRHVELKLREIREHQSRARHSEAAE